MTTSDDARSMVNRVTRGGLGTTVITLGQVYKLFIRLPVSLTAPTLCHGKSDIMAARHTSLKDDVDEKGAYGEAPVGGYDGGDLLSWWEREEVVEPTADMPWPEWKDKPVR